MFKKILTIFRKKEKQESGEPSDSSESLNSSASADSNEENPNLGLFKRFNTKFPKFFLALKFYIILTTNIAVVLFGIKFIMEYRDISLSNSIINNQTILVNVETDEIFVGSLYKSDEEKVRDEQEAEISPEEIPAEPFTGTQKIQFEQPYRSDLISESDASKAKIAILFIDLGLNRETTNAVMELGNKFSLGFTPYAPDLSNWIEQANSKKFETYLNLPMQAADYPFSDPGPHAMLNNLSIGENLSRLGAILDKNKKIIGLFSKSGENFTSSRTNFLPILNNLKENKLLFINGNIEAAKTIDAFCSTAEIQCPSANMIIDSELNESTIKKNLQILEGLALKNGSAIGFANAYPITIKTINEWQQKINPNSLVIVPLSALVDFEYKSKNDKK